MTSKLINQGYYEVNAYSKDPILEGATREFALLFREDGLVCDYQDALNDKIDSWVFDLIIETNKFYTSPKQSLQIGDDIGEYSIKMLNGHLHLKAVFHNIDSIWNKIGFGQLDYSVLYCKIEEGCLIEGEYNICFPISCGDGEHKQGRYQYFFDKAEWKRTIL